MEAWVVIYGIIDTWQEDGSLFYGTDDDTGDNEVEFVMGTDGTNYTLIVNCQCLGGTYQKRGENVYEDPMSGLRVDIAGKTFRISIPITRTPGWFVESIRANKAAKILLTYSEVMDRLKKTRLGPFDEIFDTDPPERTCVDVVHLSEEDNP